MGANRAVKFLFILTLLFFWVRYSFAQKPDISYDPAKVVYKINTAITALVPENKGGDVPKNAYGEVSTFAGSTTPGYVNGQGTTAKFKAPVFITHDKNGNFFVSDQSNGRIRMITPDGVVTSYTGDQTTGGVFNGPREVVGFSAVNGIVFDNAGNMFIVDTNNNAIYKMTPDGIVSTFAGGAAEGYKDGQSSDAIFDRPVCIAIDPSGNLFVTDLGNHVIRKITPGGLVSTFAGRQDKIGAADGLGQAATFRSPYCITSDANGNLYVTDIADHLIRKITPAGMVTRFVGRIAGGSNDGKGTSAGFSTQAGLTIDVSGNIYVADFGNRLVRKVTPDGVVTTIAGDGSLGSKDGPASQASFWIPCSVTIGKDGNLYVADNNNFEIRKVSLAGYTIDKTLPLGLSFDPNAGTISGTPTTTSPATDYTVTAQNSSGNSSTIVNIKVSDNGIVPLPLPPKISYVTPNVYTVNKTITSLAPKNNGGDIPKTIYGQVTTYAKGTPIGNPKVDNNFNSLAAITMDNAYNIYIVDEQSNAIKVLGSDGTVNFIAGGDIGYHNGHGADATFFAPYGIIIGNDGNLYIGDQENNVIRKVTLGGDVTTFAGSGSQGLNNGSTTSASFYRSINLVSDNAGNFYVSDSYNNMIRKISAAGVVTTLAGGTAGLKDATGTSARFFQPNGLALDASGNVVVADQRNHTIRKITQGGVVTTFAGNGKLGSADGKGNAASFNQPSTLFFDRINNLYVADSDNYLVREITPDGTVTTIAGDGKEGYLDGIGRAAEFDFLSGITGDLNGNLFVADRENNLIREIVITGYTIDKTLPAGLTFDATTGIISGTPTELSPATIYKVTAYNIGGSSSTNISIEVVAEHTVNFAPIADKTVCDADFDPGATGKSAITYTSSNTAVATVVSGKIHIVGPGASTITASDGVSQVQETLTIVASVTPTITVSPAAADDCQGALVTFTATITNGGTSPVYQWQVNGNPVGTNSNRFASNSLNNNDKITCILTSNAICASSPTATSNIATFTIDQPVATSVSIISTASGPICAGTQVSFIATAVTTDPNPVFQWQLNGVNSGVNSSTFSSQTLTDGDIVTCNVTSTAKCLINPVATSNSITTNLNPESACIIIIPNTFTPNGDGINDTWNITLLSTFADASVSVFTRYGTVVYSSIGYPKPWDGNENGKKLPVGTYYYLIDLKNGKKPLSGYVTIIR